MQGAWVQSVVWNKDPTCCATKKEKKWKSSTSVTNKCMLKQQRNMFFSLPMVIYFLEDFFFIIIVYWVVILPGPGHCWIDGKQSQFRSSKGGREPWPLPTPSTTTISSGKQQKIVPSSCWVNCAVLCGQKLKQKKTGPAPGVVSCPLTRVALGWHISANFTENGKSI